LKFVSWTRIEPYSGYAEYTELWGDSDGEYKISFL
jgi:hypothetical protein